MTKAARRKKPIPRRPRPPQAPAKPKLKINRSALIFTIIAVLAAIPFCMGKYIEFGTPDPYDSGSNVYSAKRILDGARIGIDEKPSAALGTLLVNMLGVWVFGFNEIGPEVIQTILQAAALIVMFLIMRRLFGTLSAAVGVIVASDGDGGKLFYFAAAWLEMVAGCFGRSTSCLGAAVQRDGLFGNRGGWLVRHCSADSPS